MAFDLTSVYVCTRPDLPAVLRRRERLHDDQSPWWLATVACGDSRAGGVLVHTAAHAGPVTLDDRSVVGPATVSDLATTALSSASELVSPEPAISRRDWLRALVRLANDPSDPEWRATSVVIDDAPVDGRYVEFGGCSVTVVDRADHSIGIAGRLGEFSSVELASVPLHSIAEVS